MVRPAVSFLFVCFFNLDISGIQSINNVFDVTDAKYSTDKGMALCHLSGWFYINSKKEKTEQTKKHLAFE